MTAVRTNAAPSPRGAPGSRSAYHHGDLPAAMIAAAAELLRAKGIEGISLRAAAAQAGVSSAAPYRHFSDKDALLVEVASQGYRSLQDQVRAAPRSRGTLATIRALVLSYVDFALTNPELYRLMMGSGIADRHLYPELTRHHQMTCDILIDAVAEAQQRGQAAGTDSVGVAMTLWCTAHGLATLAADGRIPAADVEAEAQRSLRIMEIGLKQRS